MCRNPILRLRNVTFQLKHDAERNERNLAMGMYQNIQLMYVMTLKYPHNILTARLLDHLK